MSMNVQMFKRGMEETCNRIPSLPLFQVWPDNWENGTEYQSLQHFATMEVSATGR